MFRTLLITIRSSISQKLEINWTKTSFHQIFKMAFSGLRKMLSLTIMLSGMLFLIIFYPMMVRGMVLCDF